MENKLFIGISELSNLPVVARQQYGERAGIVAYIATTSQPVGSQKSAIAGAAPVEMAASNIMVQLYTQNSVHERVFYWVASLGRFQYDSEQDTMRIRKLMENVTKFISEWLTFDNKIPVIRGIINIPNNIPLLPGDTEMFEIDFERGELIIPTPSVL